MKKNTRRQALKWLGSAFAGVLAAGPFGLFAPKSARENREDQSTTQAARQLPSRKVKPASNSVMRNG